MGLGDYVIRYRASENITAEELAEKIDCSPSTISKIENGWTDKCNFKRFAKLVVLMKLNRDEVYDVLQTEGVQCRM